MARVGMRVVCLVVATGALACSAVPAGRTPHEERGPLRPVLVLDHPVPERTAVGSSAALLAAARRGDRNPTGGLAPITEVRWRDRTFSAAAIADALAVRARSHFPEANADGVPSANEFLARHGQAHDAFWPVLMAGYLEQLEQTYGILATSADITRARDRPGQALLVTISGVLPEPDGSGEYHVRWQGGDFELSGLAPAPRPPIAPPAVAQGDAHPVETVVLARSGQYYAYPTFSWTELRFFATTVDGTPTMTGGFAGQVRRAHAEQVAYRTSDGRALARVIPTEHWTNYVKLRPRDPNPFGLAQDLHLVRVTFDDAALPGSALMTTSLTVLDGSADYPMDANRVYASAAHRFDAVWRGALVTLQPDIAAIEQHMAAVSKAWPNQLAHSGGRLSTEQRQYTNIQPTFEWDAAAATITFGFSFEQRVTKVDRYSYPNPELEHFHCPAGRPCAVPPDEAHEEQEQVYAARVNATYTFDRHGALVAESATQPTVTEER